MKRTLTQDEWQDVFNAGFSNKPLILNGDTGSLDVIKTEFVSVGDSQAQVSETQKFLFIKFINDERNQDGKD